MVIHQSLISKSWLRRQITVVTELLKMSNHKLDICFVASTPDYILLCTFWKADCWSKSYSAKKGKCNRHECAGAIKEDMPAARSKMRNGNRGDAWKPRNPLGMSESGEKWKKKSLSIGAVRLRSRKSCRVRIKKYGHACLVIKRDQLWKG